MEWPDFFKLYAAIVAVILAFAAVVKFFIVPLIHR